jgi:transposase
VAQAANGRGRDGELPVAGDPFDVAEFEYDRHGVQQLLAAFDICTGHVLARVVPQRTAEATVAFLEEVARHYPTQPVYVVWDNLNTHRDSKSSSRWADFNARHDGRFHFVFTPKHASWLNQVEIWFSILHRRVLRAASFDSRERQKSEVEAFYWNQVECHPFRWTWRVTPKQTRPTVRARAARNRHARSARGLLLRASRGSVNEGDPAAAANGRGRDGELPGAGDPFHAN